MRYELQDGVRAQLGSLAEQVARDAGIELVECHLLGSFAEGLANPGSDIDLMVLAEGDVQLPRHVTRVSTHRTEIYFASRTGLSVALARLDSDPEQLDFFQRLRNAHTLVRRAGARAFPFAPADLDGRIDAHFTARAHEHAVCAFALAEKGASFAAEERARHAAVYAVKAFCARAGDSYMPLKWAALQLERCGAAPALLTELQCLLTCASPLHALGAWLAKLGIPPRDHQVPELTPVFSDGRERSAQETRRARLLASKAIEVQLEDANGALLAEQWSVVQWSLRCIAASCATVLAASELPGAPDEVACLLTRREGPLELRRAIEQLRCVCVPNREAALDAVPRALALAARVRETADIAGVPLASESLEAWRYYDQLSTQPSSL